VTLPLVALSSHIPPVLLNHIVQAWLICPIECVFTTFINAASRS